MDLFDQLPDELLIHIISFLPTKYAVLTSVLSKRWEFLWCYANKSLEFDDSSTISLHEDVGYYGLNVHDRVYPFAEFVDRVLKLNKAPQIENIFLKLHASNWSLNDVRSWLRDIVSTRKVKEIQFHLSTRFCMRKCVPVAMFNSASLRVLKLYFANYLPLGEFNHLKHMNLPNLKILHFWMGGINMKMWFLKHLFRASPQLEEAYIGGYLGSRKCFCNIYTLSLKKLWLKFQSAKLSNKFLINAPILEELVVVDESFQHLVIKSNCLVNAKVDIGFPYVRKFQQLQIHVHRVCKTLCRISNVKFLNLRARTTDALSICCNNKHKNMPHRFVALRHLKLCFLNYSAWDVIAKLLECAQNLEVLVISKDLKGKQADFRRDSFWTQPSSVPVCLLSSLRRVEVWDCESHQVEFSLITYLLKHGHVLRTFLVELLPADSRDDLRFREELMSIPRGSKTCELKVSAYSHCSRHRGRSSPDDEDVRRLAHLQCRMPPQKMSYEDLRVCTDYFSNDHLLIRTKMFKVYRGKLYQSSELDSPVRDVVVKKWVIRAKKPYSKHKEMSMSSFREELKVLKHPNFKYHPYFMNLLGYCAEDNNERLGVVYDFRAMSCLKTLIPKDSFKWLQRIKVALVLACISEYMHGVLPFLTPRLCPSSVILDEDYMPVLFNFNHRLNFFREYHQYHGEADSMSDDSTNDFDVYKYGLTLLGLISKRVHQCPSGRDHTIKCRTMHRWAKMQVEDRYLSSSLCKSQTPLVHKNLMGDLTYDVGDGLKLTRLAMRCLDTTEYRPSMHGIVKYLCKLRVVRENWDILDCDNIIA